MGVVKNKSGNKVFRSRISILLIVFVLAVFIPVSIPIIQNKVYPGMYVLGGTFFLLMFLLSGIRYIISGSKLLLKIWFIPCCDQESKMQQKWESECSIIGNSNTSKMGTIMQR